MKEAPQHTAKDLIFHNLRVIPSADMPIQSDWSLRVRGGAIVEMGPSSELKGQNNCVEYSMAGMTVIPGLCNAHIHSPMSFFRGLGHHRPKNKDANQTMIEDFFFPVEKSLSAELMEPLAYSYLIDGLKAGVTCFGDAYFFTDGICKAMERLGVKGAVGEHHADLGGPLPAGPELWKKTRQSIENWQYSRIKPVVYAHATDTVSPGFLGKLASYAKSEDLPFHMHLSQSQGEYHRVMEREKISPVAVAEKCGALGPRSLLVHLLSASDDDLQRIAGSGAVAGLCPISEVIYEQAPLAKSIMDLNIPVALGTDCAASCDGADVLAEAKFFALLLKMQGCHYDNLPQELFRMVTTTASHLFGFKDTGTLEIGKKADLVFIDHDISLEPSSQPLVNLFFSSASRNVRHVMIDGQWVLFDKEVSLFSEQQAMADYNLALDEIKKRTGLDLATVESR